MLSFKNLPKLPDGPGVYFFLGSPNPPTDGEGGKNKRDILYIGKATSLRDRVRSYFAKDLIKTRGARLTQALALATRIGFQPTDSVLEALLLEAELIRRYQPKYNVEAKDDKSFNYVVITKEEIPRVLIKRGRELTLQPTTYNLDSTFGPFPHGGELKEAIRIVRRLFPYHDKKSKVSTKNCFDYQIGLCPGVCGGIVSVSDYRKTTLRHLKLFFRGRKKELIKSLEREMKQLAKQGYFEAAGKLRDKIFALNHIQDVSLLKRKPIISPTKESFRIEAYDIAHTSGKETVGVMTVVEDGEKATGEYRMFKIKGLNPDGSAKAQLNNDTANLAEVLTRRINHFEWRKPDLIVVDGGRAQLNAARKVLSANGWEVPLVAVVKDERHRPRAVLNLPRSLNHWQEAVLLANSESHRFALAYHRRRRGKIV